MESAKRSSIFRHTCSNRRTGSRGNGVGVRVFISSVVNGFEDYRGAARRAIETVDAVPVMCEDFGARPYSSERTCRTEIESSDVYVVILGGRYGYEHQDKESVTQQEFRHAISLRLPILIFVQDVEMEPSQAEFRNEVSAYHSGFCRERFSTPEELERKLIKNLLRLGRAQKACSQSEFSDRVERARSRRDHYDRGYEARFMFAFLPQPMHEVRLHELESQRNEQFVQLCNAGFAQMRQGFDLINETDCSGLRSGETVWRQYDDGFLLLESAATQTAEGITFSNWYVTPSHLRRLAEAAFGLVNANGGWCRLGLGGMQQAVIAELPDRASNSFSLSHRSNDGSAAEDKLLIPCTEAAYRAWLDDAIARLQRRFGPR